MQFAGAMSVPDDLAGYLLVSTGPTMLSNLYTVLGIERASDKNA